MNAKATLYLEILIFLLPLVRPEIVVPVSLTIHFSKEADRYSMMDIFDTRSKRLPETVKI